MTLQDIISKTEEFLSTPSVVRHEGPFMERLADEFNMPGYEIEKDNGVLAVRKKGSRSPNIVTAHIDRHGIVVNDEGNFEYAAYNAKKHYGDENTSSESVFEKSGKRFIGEPVFGYDEKGDVLEEGVVKNFSYDYDNKDLLFDIEGMEGLPPGTPIAYVSHLERDNENLSSQIDNVISVATAYQLVKDGFDGTLILSTEEEIGHSWRYIADYLQKEGTPSQNIITLDTTPYDDNRAISEGLIVLRNKDENGTFNADLVNRLRESFEKQGRRYEMKDEVVEAQNTQLGEGEKPKKIGKTELGRIIQYTEGEFNGATMQIPTTNYHSNHETTSEQSLMNYYGSLKDVQG